MPHDRPIRDTVDVDASGGGAFPMATGTRPRGSAGQTLAEYALILSLIAILAVLCVLWLGQDIAKVLSDMGRML
jgi:hypothetical protein